MSDIRFNRWLHQSGTGGVSQDSSGNIGIGTTVPTEALDVRGNLSVSDTITATTGTFSGNISAVDASYTGNVTIGGTLTYEDVANIDSVGIITARSDVHVGAGLSVVGVSTLGNTVVGGATTELIVGGDARITGILTIGTSSLTLDGTNNNITVGAGITISGNTGIISATGGINAKLLGTPELTAISSSISDTAVDVFVYDTRKDSDGGAWRKRTQHTSWYNETLNTSIRGSRREFPAVAVITVIGGTVSSYGSDNGNFKINIYDGDDPDLPLWMEFNGYSNTNSLLRGGQNYPLTSVYALNGSLYFARNGGYGIGLISFIDEKIYSYWDTSGYTIYNGNISQRNSGSNAGGYNGTGIVNATVNDVTMTVLPNAPIDSATGLPVPTIAVATDGGVSIIKDNGTVVDIIDSNSGYRKNLQVKFTTDNKVVYTETSAASEYGWMYIHEIPSSDETITINTKDTALGWYDTRTQPYMQNILGVTIDASINVDRNVGLNVGIGTIIPNIVTGNNHIFVAPAENSGITIIEENRSSTNSGLVAYATTSYNTGWQHGDIKGAFLSDTDATNVTGSELVTNGTFDSDVSGWTTGTSTITYNSGAANIARNNSGAAANQIYQNISGLTIGQKYLISIKITALTNFVSVYFDPDGSDPLVEPIIATATGTYTAIYTATQTSGKFSINATGNTTATATVDDISMRVAELDRSVNNKGLQVFGTVTKSPVAGSGATAAELVAYSGWSASNYLIQPYNSGLDFGTGDLSVIFWYKSTSGNLQCILHRGDGNSSGWGSQPIIQIEFNGVNLAAFLSDSGFSAYDTVGIPIATSANGVWNHYVLTRSGGTMKVYFNGSLYGSTTSTRTLTNTSARTWIGERPNSSRPATNTSLALFRMGSTAPSPEQIKKIYEDEKVLFQENAACTLYGSSDAVTALAYDDSNDLLHVGTSSGRSDFQGLRRINNTTTAVTTAMSASNGLVAEQ